MVSRFPLPKATADDVYQAMTIVDFAKTAIVEGDHPSLSLSYQKDSLASIRLIENRPQEKIYTFRSSQSSFAVFSEMFYKKGWVATIDEQESQIYPVNYVLRGLQIPAGEHQIRFRFVPRVIQLGSGIQLVAIVLLILLIAACIRQNFQQQKQA